LDAKGLPAGFLGCRVLLGLYGWMLFSTISLAQRVDSPFAKLVLVGIVAMWSFQLLQNVGMCIGVMPITGIPLPFISYGGTNLVVNMAGIALVLNVTNHKKTLDLRSSRNNE
ncbi:MAG: FtsW/RodA/SpoVE family cell cycle protein, partial [Clostridia bacterium]|nr:FtsW/RodA/SpoVE family cell cycle protein [Clostridia bacterium]